jgi:hypothetical protein
MNLSWSDGSHAARAGQFLYYHPAIYVPAHGTGSARMRCTVPQDVTLLWAASHQHGLGSGFTARVLGRTGVELFRLLDAEGALPVARSFASGFRVQRGEVIEVECRYANPLDRAVIEGPSAVRDEMCMLVATYFPQIDVPLGEGCQGSASGPVFQGTRSCGETLGCLTLSVDEVSAEKCWVETSATSSASLVDLLLRCLPAECAEQCAQGRHDAACDGCLAARCAEPRATCLNAP